MNINPLFLPTMALLLFLLLVGCISSQTRPSAPDYDITLPKDFGETFTLQEGHLVQVFSENERIPIKLYLKKIVKDPCGPAELYCKQQVIFETGRQGYEGYFWNELKPITEDDSFRLDLGNKSIALKIVEVNPSTDEVIFSINPSPHINAYFGEEFKVSEYQTVAIWPEKSAVYGLGSIYVSKIEPVECNSENICTENIPRVKLTVWLGGKEKPSVWIEEGQKVPIFDQGGALKCLGL